MNWVQGAILHIF